MKNCINWVCRNEIFGATLYNKSKKQKLYISDEEFFYLKKHGEIKLFEDIIINSLETRFVNNEVVPNNAFSAPDGIYLEITRRCNLACSECFNGSGRKLQTEWTWGNISRLLQRLYEIGTMNIRFTGGEPFCEKDILIKSLNLAKTLGIATSIGTNGTLITEEIAQELLLSKVELVIVSIDGLRTLHDSVRGRGSFEKSIFGIKILTEKGIKTRINVVAMQGILDDIDGLIKLANELNVDIVIRRMINTGRSDKKKMLSPSDYVALNKAIEEINKHSIVNIFSHYDLHKEAKLRLDIPFYSSKCSCGTRGLGILPNGDVFACGFLAPLGDQFKAGNVNETDIIDIWLNSPVLNEQRDSSMKSFCRTGCFKKDVCKGSCPVLLNCFNGKDPYCGVVNS